MTGMGKPKARLNGLGRPERRDDSTANWETRLRSLL